LVLVWWLFFSRASWLDRVGALVVAALTVALFKPLVDKSISGGAMGLMMPMFSIPTQCLALVAGLWASLRVSDRVRRVIVSVALMLGAASFMLVRTAGMFGGGPELHWRWTPTPEDRLLAQPAELMPPPATLPPMRAAIRKDAEWPGFRGPNRDDVIRGV